MNLITIYTFTLPHEMAVIRGRLESEGIACHVKDELTVQVHNFHSNAIGGIKLQVDQNDVEVANEILKTAGLAAYKPEGNAFWTKLDASTKNIPGLNQLRPELRFLVIVAVPTVIIGILLSLAGS